jgi:hypothetical protein
MARITRKTAGGCEDRSCPAVYETDDPETVAIQGSLPVTADDLTGAGAVPGHEGILLVPAALLRAWASGQQ